MKKADLKQAWPNLRAVERISYEDQAERKKLVADVAIAQWHAQTVEAKDEHIAAIGFEAWELEYMDLTEMKELLLSEYSPPPYVRGAAAALVVASKRRAGAGSRASARAPPKQTTAQNRAEKTAEKKATADLSEWAEKVQQLTTMVKAKELIGLRIKRDAHEGSDSDG